MSRSPAMEPSSHRVLFLLSMIVFALGWAPSLSRAQSMQLTEHQIKAGFLFNFTKFVEWPPDAFADAAAPFVLGVIGDDNVETLLTAVVVGKSVNGRPVIVKRFGENQELKDCQIILIGSSDEKRATQILAGLKKSGILTVGETPGFIRAGGMINFFVEENKVKLDINVEAAGRAHMKISSKLIAVSRPATRGPAGKS